MNKPLRCVVLVLLLNSSFQAPLMEPLVDSPATTVGSDFNGNGIHDFITGGDSNDDAATGAGAAYILYGSAALSSNYDLTGVGVDVTLLGNDTLDTFGYTVSSAGDINSDGFDDIIVGAYNDEASNAADTGLAHILYGSPNLSSDIRASSGDFDVTIVGKRANDDLSQGGFSGGGDINGDGFDDVSVSAPANDDANIGIGATANQGAVYILYGGASLSQTYDLSGTGVDVTILGKNSGDTMGRFCDTAGDLNSDGFDDVIMGARLDDSGAANAGAAYILYGGSSISSNIELSGAGVSVTLLGKAGSDYFGLTVSGLGDINGDGFSDVIVGADSNDDFANLAGAAYIFYGRASRVAGTTVDTGASEEDVSILGRVASDRLTFHQGASVVGDINDDGLYDLLVSAYSNSDAGPTLTDAGTVYLFYGSTSFPSQTNAGNANVTLLGKSQSERMGRSVTGVGDLNDDGIPDFAIGSYGNDDGGGDSGAAYIIFGSRSLSSTIEMVGGGPDITIIGKNGGDRLGRIVGGGRGATGP